jgi:hypothetical protein
MTCPAACQAAESPGCRCRECRGELHGVYAAQQRLPLIAMEDARTSIDVDVDGRLVHVSPATRHHLDGRVDRGWIARLGGGSRRKWGRTPEEAARER